MVGLLVKKEMKNLFRTYFINQKSGKGFSKGRTAGFVCLFIFLMIILMAMFFGVSLMMVEPLVSGGRDCCFHALQICKCDGSDSGACAGGEGVRISVIQPIF